MASSNNYMEEAIEKASKLIDLLRKENNQLKEQNAEIQRQARELLEANSILERENGSLRENEDLWREELDMKQSQVMKMKQLIATLEDKVQEKTQKNQQLHSKLAELTGKSQTMTKNYQKQRVKNLSLNNQNQYLLKVIATHQQKQNGYIHNQQQVQNQHHKELSLLQRSKQAFSRKWQELKYQNSILTQENLQKNVYCAELEEKYEIVLEKLERLSGMEREFRRAEEVITNMIESTLKVKAEGNLLGKVEQLRNYLGYRLQHIENLLKPIFQYFSFLGTRTDPIKIRDLQSINSLTGRLNSYISQLIK